MIPKYPRLILMFLLPHFGQRFIKDIGDALIIIGIMTRFPAQHNLRRIVLGSNSRLSDCEVVEESLAEHPVGDL